MTSFDAERAAIRERTDDFFDKLGQRVLDQIDFAVLEQKVLTMHAPQCAITRLAPCDCGAERMLDTVSGGTFNTARHPWCPFCKCHHAGGDKCLGHHP